MQTSPHPCLPMPRRSCGACTRRCTEAKTLEGSADCARKRPWQLLMLLLEICNKCLESVSTRGEPQFLGKLRLGPRAAQLLLPLSLDFLTTAITLTIIRQNTNGSRTVNPQRPQASGVLMGQLSNPPPNPPLCIPFDPPRPGWLLLDPSSPFVPVHFGQLFQ